ncbi:MAG TPA: ATP-binding protein [Acidimicrobiales bacterium]|nr:ATP-binding protein [Acidimicrobiales bacterium]
MGWRVQAEFDADERSVPDARSLVASTLRSWHVSELEASACLLATELATNAVVHARTPYRITLELGPPNLRVLVADGSRALPSRRPPDSSAVTGRGLSIVEALALDWGARHAGDGKVVWFDLATGPGDSVSADRLTQMV